MIITLSEQQVAYQRELEILTESPLVVLLESGEWAAIRRFGYTTAIIVGLTPWDYRTRYCYPRLDLALSALLVWDGSNDPPGHWLKEKGRGHDRGVIDRLNPHVCNCEYSRECCSHHHRAVSS